MIIKGWCRYFEMKKGGRYYDMDTFAYARKRSKGLYADALRHLKEPNRTEWLNEATYCKVTVTIEPRQ